MVEFRARQYAAFCDVILPESLMCHSS